jgi:hypothetical protein
MRLVGSSMRSHGQRTTLQGRAGNLYSFNTQFQRKFDTLPLTKTRSVSLDTSLTSDAPETMMSVHIQQVTYEEGTYSVTGRLLAPNLPPHTVYKVLTDYESLPRVFHNVEECDVVRDRGEGTCAISQRCSWRFLFFRGSFVTELDVEENWDDYRLSFSLKKSAFMRKFVGSWHVQPLEDGGSEIWHILAVAPVVVPPQKIGDMTKNIFISQVESILKDLADELQNVSGMPKIPH